MKKKDQMKNKLANVFGHMIYVVSTIHIEGVLTHVHI